MSENKELKTTMPKSPTNKKKPSKKREFRFIERFRRIPETAEVKNFFIVQELKTTGRIFGKSRIFGMNLDFWETCGELTLSRYVMHPPSITAFEFATIKKAKKYRDNLLLEIPDDKIHT